MRASNEREGRRERYAGSVVLEAMFKIIVLKFGSVDDLVLTVIYRKLIL
jgi:hypothetical protein